MVQVFLACHLGCHGPVVHFHYVGDEVGYVVGLGEYEHHQRRCAGYIGRQKHFELVAGRGIEAYKWVVDDEQPCLGKESAGNHILAQLTARQQDDGLVEKWPHLEYIVQVLAQRVALGGIFALGEIGTVEQLANRRHLGIHLLRLPALLQKISLVYTTVRVTEGNVTDIVGEIRFAAGREIIIRLRNLKVVATAQDVYQHGLSASVRACDGNLLSFQQLQAEGMAHGKLGDGAYPIVYPDYTLLSH